MSVYTTATEDETIALGAGLALGIQRPAIILLIGQLGAGKTTLTKGIVKGLGAGEPDDVSSPTFTLIHEYGRDVYHIDLYRLDTWREVASLGLDDLFDRDSIVLIEWGERFPELVARASLRIILTARGDERTIEMQGR